MFSLDAIPVTGASSEECPAGVSIISQTCDIVLSSRPNVIVAKVVQLPAADAKQATEGFRPRYVGLPDGGECMFVDLEHIHAVSKIALLGKTFVRAVNQDDAGAVRRFSFLVGRRFSRFAFPDAITHWFDPLRKTIEDKYSNPDSPLGRALSHVVELRVQADNWNAPLANVTLHVIVKSGSLPEVADEHVFPEASLAKWLRPNGDLTRTSSAIADRLCPAHGPKPSNWDAYHLWSALGEALANECRPKAKFASQPGVSGAISSISGQIWSEDEFSLTLYRDTEMLDLDHLSVPVASPEP
ncbi:hypothetical protein E3T54_13060 [Cryobacterium sp. Sr8]|uniref:hypothetical protein n=1 Tax=Cryobacterium sp. Sr8 TaxID=1259203 RepID=UPI00106D8EEF|nr:hypothetical protein [Cryobacterium sp. Sr8]TFD74873.1 hypothetical protein E3T54_13060 [Cryobacterium sp. Sr8]